jgi:UDP-glucose 6-dehydrogenase
MATTHGTHPQLLKSVMDINKYQRGLVIQKLHDLLGRKMSGKTIGGRTRLLGLQTIINLDHQGILCLGGF